MDNTIGAGLKMRRIFSAWIKVSFRLVFIIVMFYGFTTPAAAQGENIAGRKEGQNFLLESGRFIHIPGPNPIVVPGPSGSWDDNVIETSDAFKDFGTYYIFYHGTGQGKGYQLGVATADNPLGPFEKRGDKPVLKLGPEGSWDDRHVACAMVLKVVENPDLKLGEGSWEDWVIDRYYMWYSGYGTSSEYSMWSIGLATASHPLGPWKKYEGNPIIKDFGYVGGVVEVEGKYYLYTAYPISSTGPDYSPMSLAVADSPEGPWEIWENNPVLKEGSRGEWDDGGFSEAEVLYHSGVFHMFYGGAKLYSPRILTRESVGYAYSFDGYNFVKYGLNPVAPREANPNAAAFAEVHAIIESPFIYLYHTLRYKKLWRQRNKEKFPVVEDLGVQVLVTQRPFALDMPLVSLPEFGPNKKISLNECPPVNLSNITRVSLTAECMYSSSAKQGIRLHVLSSYDGERYDTTDLYTFDNAFLPGEMVRKTFELESNVRFIKVLVENLDGSESVTDLKITVTLGG